MERNQVTPHLDDYTYDSSDDDSDVDDIYGIRRVVEDNEDTAEVNGEDEVCWLISPLILQDSLLKNSGI